MQHPGHSMPEFQKFHEWLDKEKGFGPDLFMNTVCLQSEVGELCKEILQYKWTADKFGPDAPEVEAIRVKLGHELADVFAYLLKIANYTGHDLQAVYTEKMIQNIQRQWELKRT
ncbi:MAG TPA: MazG-like family protein [Symbiobacteriaceae bacterium]|nr:MazG-like family protein [Symbiobacteriaceae bacterium]